MDKEVEDILSNDSSSSSSSSDEEEGEDKGGGGGKETQFLESGSSDDEGREKSVKLRRSKAGRAAVASAIEKRSPPHVQSLSESSSSDDSMTGKHQLCSQFGTGF